VAISVSSAQDFFDSLPNRGREPLLAKASGTLRFDAIDDGRVEYWYVTLANGEVSVSRKNAKADAVIRLSRALLDEIVTGRANAMAALLRGAIIPEGDPALMLRFQRIFSGSQPLVPPETSSGPRAS
jgi:putative sterol carrier protein